jgi:hypothetical protein
MSNATPRTIALGNATITIINVGDMMVDLAQEIGVPESEWRSLYREGFASSRPYPSQCAHIALAHASILVEAGDYVQAIALEPSYLPPVYLSYIGYRGHPFENETSWTIITILFLFIG